MSKEKPKLTKEFCENNTVMFFPKTTEEAYKIQKKIFQLGFSWGNRSRRLQHLEESVRLGLVLNNYNSLLLTPSETHMKIGVVCTLEDFYPDGSVTDLEDLTETIVHLSSKDRKKILQNLKEKCADDFKEVAYIQDAAKTKRNVSVRKPLPINKRKN